MDQPKLKAGSTARTELKIFIGTSTAGFADAPELNKSPVDENPDVFRTAVVIPEKSEPYPYVGLEFETESATPNKERLVMNEFC